MTFSNPRLVDMARLAYRGVLIERPCVWCDGTSFHYDGQCSDGPCSVCGIARHDQGRSSHPRNADGTWRYDDTPQHDWAPHSYLPADVDNDEPAFIDMLEQCIRVGYPEHYTTDLFRDYQFIQREPEARFVWILRPFGTHIITPGHGWLGSLNYLSENEPKALVFYWNGYSLDEVSWDTARCVLAARAPVYR